MVRRPPISKRRPSTTATAAPVAPLESAPAIADGPGFWTRGRLIFAVAAILVFHVALAVESLVLESPTIDEVVHLPAGLTYLQTGSFRLYHHNPPLVKLVAALPVWLSGPRVDYRQPSWTSEPPNKAAFAHEFMELNAENYFELFTRARLLMPVFSVIGGLVVFAWSRRLFGDAAGLLSLTLWALCPNVLAHTRLVTTDVGAASFGVLATYLFWRSRRDPSARRAVLAGICLGLAQLTKFSLVLLYLLWPTLAALQWWVEPASRSIKKLARDASIIVILSLLVINAGYLFEGVGIPLGDYEFTCSTLTKPVPPGMKRPASPDTLLNGAYRYRVNRFRGTPLAVLPMPLPKQYLLGFDAQKLEAEGIPRKFYDDEVTGAAGETIDGYPVYLDGELRQESWWYYYVMTLIYKVPEGTWLLVIGSLVAALMAKRSRGTWFDEAAVLTVPFIVLFVMSFFTNINLGLRYVLPIFPYVFISVGRLGGWASGLSSLKARRLAWGGIAACLLATAGAALTVRPHYLAYFNAVSGGSSNGSKHLIDSNLDWGQDLTTLKRWIEKNAKGEPIGLAYFGQIHPKIFEARGEGFDWFLPPPLPKTMSPPPPRYQLQEPSSIRLEPGLYAVSASLVRGLPWRVYDSPYRGHGNGWAPWRALLNTFRYFEELKPIDNVGGSIFIYRVTPEDAERLSRHWRG